MTKEKIEKIPLIGQKLSEEEAKKIIEKFKLEYSEEDKKAGNDLEYFVIITKDRSKEPEKRKKDIPHYLPKWDKTPDKELGWISTEEMIEAIQKYYSEINPEEENPTREAVKQLRKEKLKSE